MGIIFWSWNSISSLLIAASFLMFLSFPGGVGTGIKVEAKLPIEQGVKRFESWPTLMYALTQGFYMFNGNIFGLNMVKDFVGMSLVID